MRAEALPGYRRTGHSPLYPSTKEAQSQLAACIAGERTRFSMTLDFSSGTVFQQTVWQALLAIPCGVTISYSTLSQQIGKPAAVRAVAAAGWA